MGALVLSYRGGTTIVRAAATTPIGGHPYRSTGAANPHITGWHGVHLPHYWYFKRCRDAACKGILSDSASGWSIELGNAPWRGAPPIIGWSDHRAEGP